jgi:hypothetical protein
MTQKQSVKTRYEMTVSQAIAADKECVEFCMINVSPILQATKALSDSMALRYF